MSENKRLIIIDCDTGVDDALALLLAFQQPDWNILGISAVSGNVPLMHTAPNCIKIATLAGREIPVFAGAAEPLYRDAVYAAEVHGENGIGGVELPEDYNLEESSALSFLTETVAKYAGELELITLGPMTNIAQAILTDPQFAARIKHITFMGGAVHGGNITAEAEFNIFADPEAARIVCKSGIPMTMVGLDVTNRALLSFDVVDRWRSSSHPIVKTAGELLHTYHHFYDGIQAPGMALHDPLAVAAVIDPAVIQTKEMYVDVETHSTCSAGKTVGDEFAVTGNKPNMQVAMDLNLQRFLDLFIGTIEEYSQ